jgi:RNA polymerase subunit RPABC4/transcription elongation factor Spt4
MILAASDSGLFDDLHDFFFGSGTSSVARNLGIFLLVIFWLAVGYWVYKDARRRIEDPWLVGAATVLGLVPPFLGAFIYMLFRPPEYLDDVRERELEIRAMEESLGRGRQQHCPVCRAEIDENFLVCPVCTTRLRQACANCKAPLEPLWQVCPYCETPIESPAPIHFPPLESPRRESRSE